MTTTTPPSAQRLERGEFAPLCYRLGLRKATGVLALTLDSGKSELLILRRGQLFTRDLSDMRRRTRLRLEGLSLVGCEYQFDDGLAAYPPSIGQPFSLTSWSRSHLEGQIDSARAHDLVRELSGARLALVHALIPGSADLDASDLRVLECMAKPYRLDQIWPRARVPRFRFLAFIHFLRAVGAVQEEGIAAGHTPPLGTPARQAAAMRTLGLPEFADRQEVKRAYRKLARELHPDLNDAHPYRMRRDLEKKFATVNSAYRELMQAVG